MGPSDIEVVDIRREDIDVLLSLLQAHRGCVVNDLQSEEVSTTARGEIDSVRGLVESGDVDDICSSGETIVSASHRDHERIYRIGAGISDVVQPAGEWETERIN